MENNQPSDIAVFTFKRGSQIIDSRLNTDSYQFVLGVINNMMTRSGVDFPKVGIGGTKEDVSMFIAGLIDYHSTYDINIEYCECDSSEFDPDIEEMEEEELG